MDLPDPTCEPDRLACIMLGIDWIYDIEVQVYILHQLSKLRPSCRAQLIQRTVTTSHDTLPEWFVMNLIMFMRRHTLAY